MNMEAEYFEKGFYLVPEVFSKEEIGRIKHKLLTPSEQQAPGDVNSSVNSSLLGLDHSDPLLKSLAALPRLLNPVSKILNGASTYLFQGRVVFKQPFGGDTWPWHGDTWPWHQDFIYFREYGIQECDMVMCIIYLDDNTEFNSPLLVIEGSHKNGVIDVPSNTEAAKIWKENFGRELKFILGEKEISPLLEKGSIISTQGKAGSVLFVNPNIVHASNLNLSPYMRTNLFLIYNDINNKPNPKKANKNNFLTTQEIHTLELSDDKLSDKIF